MLHQSDHISEYTELLGYTHTTPGPHSGNLHTTVITGTWTKSVQDKHSKYTYHHE